MDMAEVAMRRAKTALGKPSALAQRLGITVQAVCQWKTCPAKRVLAIEAVTGVSRYELRPDLYPPSERAA